MLKRPSTRRHTEGGDITLNLVPMMDALVTLITFLLFTMSFISIVALDSPVPVISRPDPANTKDQKPLQLTLTIQKDKLIIWSPFERIAPSEIKVQANGEYDVHALHDTLISIKQRFPEDTQIVFIPSSTVPYDQLVALMDSSRLLTKTDPPFFHKGPTGNDEPLTRLFPEIVFGNLLGDSE